MKIFLDCDDTILKSSKCIIDLLNKKNGTNKTIDDLKDFQYRSIDKSLAIDDVLKLFESDGFWNNVRFNQDFLDNRQFLNDNFEIEIVSCGTKENLRKKEEFLKHLGYKFKGLLVNEDLDLCKKCINMQNGIQIDDNIHSLENTNASIKILLKNGREFPWNKTKVNLDNLYVVNSWKEIFEILEFFRLNPEFVKR